MSAARVMAWLPVVREIVELGQMIAERIRARRRARRGGRK